MILNKSISFIDLYNNRSRKEFDKFMAKTINYHKSPLIYGIKNKIRNQWYIGQTKDLYQRLWNTRDRDGHCQKIDDKVGFIYDNGIENFDFYVLDECTIDELDSRELFFCERYDSYKNGYNKSVDGKGRWQKGLVYWINPETREEMRLPKDELPPSGFILGNTTLGRKCYYNPDTNEMIKLLPDERIPVGFIEGNVIKGMKVYINESTGKVIRLREGNKVPEGFVIGNNTTNKIRVYSILNKKRYTLSLEEIKSSEVNDLRLGCPRGEFWTQNKWKLREVIDKSRI